MTRAAILFLAAGALFLVAWEITEPPPFPFAERQQPYP